MKTARDAYLDQQLADPTIRQGFEEETKVLSIGIRLAIREAEEPHSSRTR